MAEAPPDPASPIKAAGGPSEPQSPTEDSRKSCWVCFANEDDDREAAWVQPCRCKGTTKWVHQTCLKRWIDEKQRGDVLVNVFCPQCGTLYVINLPKSGMLLYSFDVMDRTINYLSPFLAGGIFLCSAYWTAVTYGAVSVMQVLGHKEGLAVMERADPLFLVFGLPSIPVGLILGKMVRWEDYVLNLIRRQSVKMPLFQGLLQLPAGQEVAPAPNVPHLGVGASSATRVLCGAVVMPTIATIVGKLLFPSMQNNLHRSILGGITFTLVKGLVKIYYKHHQYIRLVNREIQNYREGQADSTTDETHTDEPGADED